MSRASKISVGAWAVAACALLVHFYAGLHYGYFRDELYYIACSKHLAWGYVDQPPLIALVAFIVRMVLGSSLFAIRLLPAVAAAAEVLMTALISREFGGGRFAQVLAGLGVLVAPGILGIDGILSMNAFEPLFWMGCAWLVIRILKTGDAKLWLWFGVVAGVGLQNKYSMLIFGAGIVGGLIFTAQRRLLASPWPWLGFAVALLIFLPNLLWNIQHHFPFVELQANIRRSGRDVPLGPLAFFGQEILAMQPLSLPVWLAGLWFFFRPESGELSGQRSGQRSGRIFRALGWAWVLTALVIVVQSPRIYYLFPAYPLLFAAGAVVWEGWLQGRVVWMRVAWPVLMVVTGAMLSPLVIPVLPPETYIRYTNALHIGQPAIETHKLGPLPQILADEFGWDEMAATVGRVYHDLPPEIRARTAIFGQNYGQAGAIDFFGPKYGLPPAISGHQNYFLWGPREYTGESAIIMDGEQKDLDRRFVSVEKVAHVEHPYSMPYEHFDVFYCRGLRQSFKEIWPQVKRWD